MGRTSIASKYGAITWLKPVSFRKLVRKVEAEHWAQVCFMKAVTAYHNGTLKHPHESRDRLS
jgi:hypothetical protein